jgi:hypothetical protein
MKITDNEQQKNKLQLLQTLGLKVLSMSKHLLKLIQLTEK